MSASRIDALRSLLARRPDDPRLRFGLAVEHLNAGELEAGVRELEVYLAAHDDEGNGWGRLAETKLRMGLEDEARSAWKKAVDAAERHGHPTMADEFREALEDLPAE